MYEYLVENPKIVIVLAIIFMLSFLVLAYKYARFVGLEKIREMAYTGFLIAEREFNKNDHLDKFDYVVGLAKETLKPPFNLIITEPLLRKTIQLWFDMCKDLLDDGKVNDSSKIDQEVQNE